MIRALLRRPAHASSRQLARQILRDLHASADYEMTEPELSAAPQ
jgi:hypothetical protein